MTYTISDFGRMIADEGRMPAYAEALRRVVRPGSVVVDIGAGTGIFSFIACGLGARRVVAIEPGDAIELARAVARKNGYENRIIFHRALSSEVVLDEPADVVVADLRGVLPFVPGHLAALADARKRLLAPGGVLIPARDHLMAALVACPELYRSLMLPWERATHGLDWSDARNAVVHAMHVDRDHPLTADAQVSVAERWATIAYGEPPPNHLEGEVHWTLSERCVAHGVAVWFDAELLPRIGFSNAPGQPWIYGRAFFPWPQPTCLEPGDEVRLELTVRFGPGDDLWAWNTRVERRGTSVVDYAQSTFLGAPFAAEDLVRQMPGYRPRLSREGQVMSTLLGWMDGESDFYAIAARAQSTFPDRFPTASEALLEVGRLARKFAI